MLSLLQSEKESNNYSYYNIYNKRDNYKEKNEGKKQRNLAKKKAKQYRNIKCFLFQNCYSHIGLLSIAPDLFITISALQ